MKKNILKIILLVSILLTTLPNPACAGVFDNIEGGLKAFNQSAGLPHPAKESDGLAGIIIKIINVVLGFVGIIFIALIIYAGFTLLFSSGNPEKLKTAFGIIRSASIGVAIIMLSYIIVNFVIVNILAAIQS